MSRYALGRDYHKVLRNALQGLADDIVERVGPMGYRVFVDSGPVLEKALARKAGIGWIGKHTNLIARDAGSYFFIGEILTDLPLPIDEAASAHCGTCSACIPACPTGAITAPYQLDARRCISYLTIELHGAIPVELRRMIGKRIYGCDDCQLVCPWNKFARAAAHPDFKMRHRLDASRLANCSRGPKRSSWSAPRDRRSAASATSAGCATSRWRWAMRRPPREHRGARPRAATILGAGARTRGLGAGGTRARAAAGLAQAQVNCRLSMSRALPSRDAVSTTKCFVSGSRARASAHRAR